MVLDGAWDRQSKGEDRDAARRLHYVAMTRARRSLALVTIGSRHPILDGLNDEPFLTRPRGHGAVDVSECGKHYRTLDPSEVDLSFAGRLYDGNASLQALERLNAGDPVFLRQLANSWQLTDRDGILVCRLAKKFTPPPNATFLHGTVYAITTRVRDDSAEEYQPSLKRDEWSVVLPELVFAPSSPQ